jgi:hypothetical protein|tara:strand:- start:76 stop:675 length:600 start_codon:yes stop_codon:yes gene_type:complete
MKGSNMKKQKPHYVNNKEFSLAVVEYVKTVEAAEKKGKEVPNVTNYIAECFLKIAQGLSHKANFIRYTYREEMVMDAVENCLKAIRNYNIDAATRTGAPNAFAYFTQICYYAFLRRLAKEKKQQDIKFKFIEKAGIEDFVHYDRMNSGSDSSVTRSFVDQLRERIEVVRSNDKVISDFAKEEKKKKPPKAKAGVELFMG